jgi:UDP-N-acetylglucosamine/UDP-N-acetyl-alpha-D-glucosaminouronate 4-epimerase
MAKYLITGVAGFVGSNIAHALIARGEQVRGIDDLTDGRAKNLTGILDRFDFRQGDITDDGAILSACAGIDYVLHQAARGSVPRSLAEPVASNHANVVGTLKVLHAAREQGVKRVIIASSSSVYGETPGLPKREDMACAPISPYAVSKYAGELYAQSYARLLGLETVCLRYFNVFGPRQHPTSQYAAVIPKFIRAMLQGEQPVIFGDGRASRDFTFVDNVVSANLLACQAPAAKVSGHVFNVATGKSVTLNQLYMLLQELTGYRGAPSYAPPRGGDIRDSLADNARARQAMGYETLVDCKEGLQRTVEWYRQEFASSASAAPADLLR